MVGIMKRVHDRYPNIKFYLVGVGFYSPMMDEMKSLITKYDLKDVICMIPWVNHKKTLGYLKGSLLYLTTSLYEGLPIAVLEALAMGKAVVASDVLGNKDCVENGKNGYLLPLTEENVDDLFAQRIIDLIEDPTQREEMGEYSLKLFQRKFLIDNRIKDLENIYRKILNK
jgi:glycosyltransferase involved in cell wall biosynthesis